MALIDFPTRKRQLPYYSPVARDEQEEVSESRRPLIGFLNCFRKLIITVTIVGLVFLGSLGLLARSNSTSTMNARSLECILLSSLTLHYLLLYSPYLVRNIPRILEYNATFGGAPSPRTQRAWEELLPLQGGFFSHPKVAPRRSDFAVFHLLHCLVGMNSGYWTTYQAASEGRRLVEGELTEMTGPAHFSHCIDLLRQNLMCHPDLTVEVKQNGGVHGFGTEHQCTDWSQLMSWVAEWEVYESTEVESNWLLHDVDASAHGHGGHKHSQS